MADTLVFATLVGSLRKGSYNAAVARTLPMLAPEGVEIRPLPSIGDIPLYNQDLQDSDGIPPRVEEIADGMRAADGVVIVTPEYNFSVPGVLKNAIDWISRLDDQPFEGKPVLIQSASPGAMGGVRSQHHLRQVMVYVKALTFTTPEVIIAKAGEKIKEGGELEDQKTREFITKQLALFADFVRRAGSG